jgi:hypothetical protein
MIFIVHACVERALDKPFERAHAARVGQNHVYQVHTSVLQEYPSMYSHARARIQYGQTLCMYTVLL